MKRSEYYQNLFPLEDLLPELNEKEVNEIVNECDYTCEADKICEVDEIDNKVNIADAAVFYQMGYERAMSEIEKKLKPIEKLY